MMFDRPAHGGMLSIGNAILFGGLPNNPGQRSIVSVAHKRAQMMDYMVAVSYTHLDVYKRQIMTCAISLKVTAPL